MCPRKLIQCASPSFFSPLLNLFSKVSIWNSNYFSSFSSFVCSFSMVFESVQRSEPPHGTTIRLTFLLLRFYCSNCSYCYFQLLLGDVLKLIHPEIWYSWNVLPRARLFQFRFDSADVKIRKSAFKRGFFGQVLQKNQLFDLQWMRHYTCVCTL